MVASRAEVLPEVHSIRQQSRLLVRQLGFLEDGEESLGMTHSQCHSMIELERHGELTAAELSELLFLDKSTMSRTLSPLLKLGMVAPRASAEDRRRKPLSLTAKGKKKLDGVNARTNAHVHDALMLLEPDDRGAVVRGMGLYVRALTRLRALQDLSIRPIEKRDDAAVARVIRTVMTEYGASGPGFAIHDAEVDAMSKAYRGKRARYFIVTRKDTILGGAGFAPLEGGDRDTCELRKMYFLPAVRGVGMGRRMLEHVLAHAKAAGFEVCYLETLKTMKEARALYERMGFEPGKKPLGSTGHFGCDAWYTRKL